MRFLAWVLIVLGGLSSCWAQENVRPPNIVFIFADDLGVGELGCYGQTKIKTPNLDKLAAEGMRLTSHYAGAPVCACSRCSLMTGKHMGHAYIRDNREAKPEGQFPIPEDTVTLLKLMHGAGYRTGAIGKWGLGGPGSSGDPMKHGLDFFFGYNCQRVAHNHYPTYLWRNTTRVPLEGNFEKPKSGNECGANYAQDLFDKEAIAFLRENKDRPFFLYCPYIITHLALQVPKEALAEYEGKWDDPPYVGGKGYLPHSRPRAAYAAMTSYLDRSVGKILEELKRLGLEENTLVIFSSDNGPTFDVGGADSTFFESTEGRRGRKGSLFEGGLRVPLLARWPGKIAAGATSDVLSANYDWLPTLYAAAGVKDVPEGIDGVNLLSHLMGGEAPKREFLYWESPAGQQSQAVRMGKWKAVRPSLKMTPDKLLLFDLEQDVAESKDLAAANPEVVKRMREIMEREHVASEEFPLVIDPL
jgi:arylsulfatase A